MPRPTPNSGSTLAFTTARLRLGSTSLQPGPLAGGGAAIPPALQPTPTTYTPAGESILAVASPVVAGWVFESETGENAVDGDSYALDASGAFVTIFRSGLYQFGSSLDHTLFEHAVYLDGDRRPTGFSRSLAWSMRRIGA